MAARLLAPLLGSIVVVLLIGGAFANYYFTTSSNLESLNGRLSSLDDDISRLNQRMSTIRALNATTTLTSNITVTQNVTFISTTAIYPVAENATVFFTNVSG